MKYKICLLLLVVALLLSGCVIPKEVKRESENVIDILNILGYKDHDHDINGWEQDTWIPFSKENENSLMLYYCGRTFEMNLSICSEEEY